MQPLRIMTLDLRAPLHYRLSSRAEAFVAPAEGERIARFDLEAAVASSVEVDPAAYLGTPALVAESLQADAGDAAIPAGKYLFAQINSGEAGEVDAELLAAAAIEVQKEGLWRGIGMESFVYLRMLAEEAGPVFQILRPIIAGGRT